MPAFNFRLELVEPSHIQILSSLFARLQRATHGDLDTLPACNIIATPVIPSLACNCTKNLRCTGFRTRQQQQSQPPSCMKVLGGRKAVEHAICSLPRLCQLHRDNYTLWQRNAAAANGQQPRHVCASPLLAVFQEIPPALLSIDCGSLRMTPMTLWVALCRQVTECLARVCGATNAVDFGPQSVLASTTTATNKCLT